MSASFLKLNSIPSYKTLKNWAHKHIARGSFYGPSTNVLRVQISRPHLEHSIKDSIILVIMPLLVLFVVSSRH
jgi:hypothetical protein